MGEPEHALISGGIGSGKSWTAAFLAIEMMRAGRPFAYIDPRGDMYRFFLAWFTYAPDGQAWWEKNRHRVRLVNPVAKCGYILGLNAIAGMEASKSQTIDPISLVANAVTSHIRYQAGFDFGEAARMTEILEGAIGLLMTEGLTLSELNFLFMPSYKTYKNKNGTEGHKLEPINPMVKGILSKCTHLGTRRFWETDFAFWSPNAKQDWPQSSKNKIFNHINNDRVAYTLCADGGLDFREIIDEQMWLFVNIPYQWLSEESTSIIGNMIVSRLFYAAMQRPDNAPDYRTFLDEARFNKGVDLPRIMETSRPKHFWLTLIVQSLNQLCRNSSGGMDYHLRDTAMALCRYFYAFNSNDLEDTTRYQQMILPAKGTETVSLNGQDHILSKAIVDEQNRQRFTSLPPRHFVYYDSRTHKYQLAKSPDLPNPVIDQAKLDFLETDQLMKTGISTKEAKEQIELRYQYWLSIVTRSQAPVAPEPPPSFEESL